MLSELFLHLSMGTPTGEKFSYTQFKQSLVENKKAVFFPALLFLAAALLLANISLINGRGITKGLQLAGFLFLGYFYLNNIQKKLYTLSYAEQNAYTCFLSLLIFLSISALLYFRGSYWPLMVIASTFCFLLPFITANAWRVFNGLFVSQHLVWQYSDDLGNKQSFVSFSNMPIRLKFLAKPTSSSETVIASTAPVRMKLGTVFFHIIQQQNDGQRKRIEHTDENGTPFFWEYYTLELGGWSKLYLNPEKSIAENNIKPNSIIVVRRVSETELYVDAEAISEPVNN